jgi:7,8-dihydropterin-6-yl-methyl-4-(beta-D-ribofuranosyl)aminobenzene 5'-phosphate synthase
MEKTSISPGEIGKIILSHQHWDHIGGINHLLKYSDKFEVFTPKSFSKNLKNEIKRDSKLIEVSTPQKISKDIWTTGELGNKVKEQSLIIKTKNGNIILTGCAHPKLEDIITKSKEFGDIYAIIGGLHSLSKLEMLKEIPLIVPCHCTEKKEQIKKFIPESYQECWAGFPLIID